MRDPQQRRRRRLGGAATLLLAVALAACGGGDDQGRAAAGDSAQTAASQGRNAPADSADCAPPPVAPDSVLRGSWAGLLGWLASESVTFPDSAHNVAQGLAPLCNNCAPMRLQLQSTATTYCLTGAQASQQRIMGMMVLLDSFPGKAPLPPIPAGDSIFLFARGNPGVQSPATLVYNRNGTATQFPGSAGWNFVFCNDGHPNNRPQAQWRTVPDTQATRTPPTGGAGAGAQASQSTEDGPGGGTYGWLACANGCCQFYTPPPTAGGPPDSIPPPPPFCPPGKP